MAGVTYPNDGYNGGSLSLGEYESLVHTEGPDGVVGMTPLGTPPVYADGINRQLWLRAGRYIRVRGRIFYTGLTDTAYPVPANATGANRTDLLVARLTRSTGLITIEVKTGTTAITQDQVSYETGVFEIPLAQSVLANAAAAIPVGNVTNRAWYVNSEGRILTTPAARPPHQTGLHITELYTTAPSAQWRDLMSDGTTWMAPSWQVPATFARKTADLGRASNTTLSADPDLSVAVLGSAVYELTCVIRYHGATGADLKVLFRLPSGADFDGAGIFLGGNSVSQSDAQNAAYFPNASLQWGCLGGGTMVGLVKGLVTVGSTAGSVTVEWAQFASSSTATVVEAGSYLRLDRVA